MKFYEVIAQFAKAGAPSFRTSGYEGYLMEARDYFNIKSRVATNPKEITDLNIIDDETIRIIFRSQAELNIPQVSRSLRLFSMYLIDEEHPLNFSELVTGKRLFRMQAAELGSETDELLESSDEMTDDELYLRITKLLYKESESIEKRETINLLKSIMGGEGNV